MTDDISKVVTELRQAAGSCYATTPAELDAWATRLESATTPAAINPASVDNQFTYSPIEPPYRLTPAITTDGHAGVALDPEGSYTYYDDYATLARQLAEAKAENREVLWSLVESQNARAHLLQRIAEAESQLAEATRRLGEVEGAARRLRSDYVRMLETARDRIRDLGGECDPVDVMERADPALRAFDAALQKEPTA